MDWATALVISVAIVCFTTAATILLVTAIKAALKVKEEEIKSIELEKLKAELNSQNKKDGEK